jgi:hypothetical protein
MPKARSKKLNPDLLAIARLAREARQLAQNNSLDLLGHLFGMVECEIDGLIENQSRGKPPATGPQLN